MSFARNFAMGQQIAQTAMDAFDNARLGAILGEAEKSRPDTLNRFSDEDAKSIHDAAAAGKEVVWDEDAGGYAVKPAAQQALPSAAPEEGSAQGMIATPAPTTNVTPRPLTDGAAEAPPAAATQQPITFKPQTHTTHLDKTTVGTLTPEQIDAGKTDYIKGRASELFNPNLGLKRLREIRDEDREDFKFGLLKTKAAQEAEELKKQQSADKAELEAFRNTATGQASEQYAKDVDAWQKTMAERDAAAKAGQPMAGEAPPRPQMPAVPLPQSIADTIQTMFARQQAGGKVDMVKLAVMSDTLKKAKDEGYVAALRAGQEGMPIDQVVKLFNDSGAARIDPKSITADEMVQLPNGMATRRITYVGPDGKAQTVDTMATLGALNQAGDYYKRVVDGLNAADKRALILSQINRNNAQAGLAGARATGASPGAAGGKAPKDKLAQVADIYKEFKPGPGGETQYAEGMSLAVQAVEKNPNASPQAIAYATQVAVKEGDSSKQITRKLDFSTGKPVAVFTDPRDGQKVTLHSMPGNYTPTPEDAARFKGEVSKYLSEEDQKIPGMASLLLGAATGSQGGKVALQNQFAGQIQQDWMTAWEKDFVAKNQRAPARPDRERAIQVTAQKAAQAAAEHMRRYDGVLSLIKQYGAQRTSQP